MKKFNLKSYQNGSQVITRGGYPVTILGIVKGTKPIVAVVHKDDEDLVFTYDLSGRFFNEEIKEDSVFDLMIEPVKKEGWINIYRSKIPRISYEGILKDSYVFSSKEIAEANAGEDYITTIKVEWEE